MSTKGDNQKIDTEVAKSEKDKDQKEKAKLRSQNKVKLSDGRIAHIKGLKGEDAMDAQDRCEGDKKMYQKILLAAALTIDGKSYVPEDVGDLPIKDYNTIFELHAELNF